jgi:hypothetical protein
MKRVILLSMFVSANAMALDFNTEWAKFADDFAKLKSKVNITVDVPRVGNVTIPVEDAQVIQVDPKSPDRLGHTLKDPEMRERVTSLYKKPDTVVYSTTIR